MYIIFEIVLYQYRQFLSMYSWQRFTYALLFDNSTYSVYDKSYRAM